jgi:hypothetical protein
MDLTWWQWSIAGACALLVGLAKTGVPGLGILVVPVLGLVIGDTVASAGYLLPLLCCADLVAVVVYRRHAQVGRLWELAPWVLGGMAIAAGLLVVQRGVLHERIGPAGVNAAVGLIVLGMIAVHVLRRRHPEAPVPTDRGHAARYGLLAGFATTVANAAGPVMNLYLLSQRLPKAEFIATGAWFFLVINLMKLPIYAPLGMITPASLVFDACLVPLVVLGALGGRRIVPHIPQGAFERAVLVLAALAALLLLVPRSAWSGRSPTGHAPAASPAEPPQGRRWP